MRKFLFLFLYLASFGLWISSQQEVFGQATSPYPYSSFLENGSTTSGYEYTLVDVTLSCPDCPGGILYPNSGFTNICEAMPQSIYATAIPAPCSSSCVSCCDQCGNFPFCSLLSPNESQMLLFSDSGAWVILSYNLSLDGVILEGPNPWGTVSPFVVQVTIQYGGTPPSDSASNEGFYAFYNPNESGALPADSSLTLNAITGGGFSLVYNPGS